MIRERRAAARSSNGWSAAALCATALALLGSFSCGDDDSPAGVGTGGRKDAGNARDAALDGALDAEIEQPPIDQPPPRDAGRDWSVIEPPPVTMPDATVTAPPTCASLGCEAMSDECNAVTCDPAQVVCVIAARADGTECGSRVLDNCSAPDECRAGVCVPLHRAAGAPCGDEDVACRLDDHCDGDGHCVDEGLAAEGTACGEQTPSDDECDEPDSCDANGECQPHHEAADTACGDQDDKCRHDDRCDGFGECQDGGFWTEDACPEGQAQVMRGGQLVELCICGESEQTFCHPEADVCEAGECKLGGAAKEGELCNSDTDTECDLRDRCVTGMCQPLARPAGTVCGNQSTNTTCDGRDACDGGGHCDARYAGPEVSCGPAPGECAEVPRCSGTGTCASAQLKDSGTACGGSPAVCFQQRACSGSSSSCPAADPSNAGAPCGNPVATDPSCDLPDSCNGGGICNQNNRPLDTPCGSNAISECSQPDSCNADGTCNPRNAIAGTDCGDQGLACFHDDSCSIAGTCTDNGFDSPCPLTGTVTAGGAVAIGVTVAVIGGNSTTTNGSGEFTLSVPLGQEVLLRVGDRPGFYGEVEMRTFGADDIGESLDLELQPDDSVTDAADALSLTVDPNKGMVFVLVGGAGLGGDEGATISSASAPSIADAGGDYQYADTIITPGGALYFYNVAPDGANIVTPVDGLTTDCANAGGLSTFPVLAHTITWVVIECQ